MPDQRLNFFSDLCEQPGQYNFKADVVIKHVDRTTYGLSQRSQPELQSIARPGLFLDCKELPEPGLSLSETYFQAAHRLVLPKAVRDSYD